MIKKVIVVDEVLESLLLYGFSPALISWTVAIRDEQSRHWIQTQKRGDAEG